MRCCFSNRETPDEDLFILYYPPTMVHQKWDKSVYACGSAEETLKATTKCLEEFFKRYILGRKAFLGMFLMLLGLVFFTLWINVGNPSLTTAKVLVRWIYPVASVAFTLLGFVYLRRVLRLLRCWRDSGRNVVHSELRKIRESIANLPENPTAENAADIMRRRCPDVISQMAFEGSYFHAFTYLDFVMFPKLKHPGNAKDLPSKHSLNRDAYYVGDLVYDNWRVFHKDDRDIEDPRFAGSDGRRGVI